MNNRDFEKLESKALDFARKSNHTVISSAHFFLAAIAVINANAKDSNGDEKDKTLRDTFVSIINKYGITKDTYIDKFYELFPRGEEPDMDSEEVEITYHDELDVIFDNIKKKTTVAGVTPSISDFIIEIFSDQSYIVFNIIDDIVGGELKSEELRKEIQATIKSEKRVEIKTLENINGLMNYSKFVKEHPSTFVGGDKNIDQLRLALACKNINSAILVGKAGTGKSAIVAELARRINEGLIPELDGKLIYQLDPGSFVAGSMYRGSFEQKFTTVINEVLKNPNVILFIDEIHTLVDLGNGEGSTSGSEIIKPYIARGQLQVIGATTDDEYSKHIEPQKALVRRFHKIHVSEPNKEETRIILTGLNEDYEKFFGRKASEELINQVVDLSIKYNIAEANPARSINMLELAFAYSKLFNDKNEVVMSEDAMDAIRLKYDLHVAENPRLDAMSEMKAQIVGQDKAIERINTGLKYVEKGIYDREKPLYSAFLAGPTGTGKTFTAQILANSYFGSPRNLIKLNMAEYASDGDVTKIVGASQSYVGFGEDTDLIKSVKQNPNSVILFDEIEKASQPVLKTLLSILDTGVMKTARGDELSFKNTIILFTSNIGFGAEHHKETGLGFCKSKTEVSDVEKDLKKKLPPEFINRVDDLIIFDSLTKEDGNTLIDRYLKEFMELSGEEIKFSEEDYKEIIENSKIEEYGARGLKRAVKKQIIKNLE